MTSIRAPLAIALGLALGVGASGAAYAQGGTRGALAGNSYVPSAYDAGCGGLFCNPLPVDPVHPNVPVPPSCTGGLLCSAFPYGMGQPFPAAETAADRQARERAVAAAAAAPPPEPVEPVAPLHRHRKKVRSAAATPRSPAPATNAQ